MSNSASGWRCSLCGNDQWTHACLNWSFSSQFSDDAWNLRTSVQLRASSRYSCSSMECDLSTSFESSVHRFFLVGTDSICSPSRRSTHRQRLSTRFECELWSTFVLSRGYAEGRRERCRILGRLSHLWFTTLDSREHVDLHCSERSPDRLDLFHWRYCSARCLATDREEGSRRNLVHHASVATDLSDEEDISLCRESWSCTTRSLSTGWHVVALFQSCPTMDQSVSSRRTHEWDDSERWLLHDDRRIGSSSDLLEYELLYGEQLLAVHQLDRSSRTVTMGNRPDLTRWTSFELLVV